MASVATRLAGSAELSLAWIGLHNTRSGQIEISVQAGASASCATSLGLVRPGEAPQPGSSLAWALEQQATVVVPAERALSADRFDAAEACGLHSGVLVGSTTLDGGQVVLALYSRDAQWAGAAEVPEWAQHVVDELSRFCDHQMLLDKHQRVSRYREAQRRIQRALLDQPDAEAVFHTLANALVDAAGAAVVAVYTVADQGQELEQMALAGPMAEVLRPLPRPQRRDEQPRNALATRAFMSGQSVVVTQPAARDDTSDVWRLEELRDVGAAGCWPIFGPLRDQPSGVLAVMTMDATAFDRELCAFLDEVSEAAGLALRQHAQRQALALERERQTYFALHDPLTELPNRRALERHVDDAFRKAERDGSMVAVGLLDLDDFKPVNDRFGHAMGDRVLVQLASRLREALAPDDYVARLGGDEFVLVFEGLEREENLDLQLTNVWRALHQPIRIDGHVFELSASLGVALYPQHASDSSEHLLRRADQAMYQAKAQKHHRALWWSLPPEVDSGEVRDTHDGHGVAPYGDLAAQQLRPWFDVFSAQLPQLVEDFYADLEQRDGPAALLKMLPASDVEAFKAGLVAHLRLLMQPRLQMVRHRWFAARRGAFYASNGIEDVWLLEAIEELRDLFAMAFGSAAHRDRRPLSIILQRLALDRQWQLESIRDLQRQRVALLARLNALAWSANSYLELIQGVVDNLIGHSEIAACAVGRPDGHGELIYEAVGGRAFSEYLRALAGGKASPISVDRRSGEGSGPTGRAWRTGRIQRCAHYVTDPAMKAWVDTATRLGVTSNVAVPLVRMPQTPVAVLTIYSPHVGGFHSEDQQAFLDQVKTVLDLALARLAPLRPGSELLPFFVRDRWRRSIATDALQMHFQPVVDLARGRVSEMEALARLRDENGELLAPRRFIPALSDDDLVTLFHHGLLQAMDCRQSMYRLGHELDVAVNLPASALQDARYLGTAATLLAASECPSSALLFEILESPTVGDGTGAEIQDDRRTQMGLRALKSLGVRLVEDDLGAGYSSLIRLRQWPFDRVKIDQALVAKVFQEPLQTLRFVRQLIRLGHDLGLDVVVEGLETPGLIEAALILGADMGQGVALGWPMAPDQLEDWLKGFEATWNAERPTTALGALAGTIVWEEPFAALASDDDLVRRYSNAPCLTGIYLEQAEGVPAALIESHERMHVAAGRGPTHPEYHRERDTFTHLLAERALSEERAPLSERF